MQRKHKTIPIRDLKTYRGVRAVRLVKCDYAQDIDIHVTLCADRGAPFVNNRTGRMVCENVEIYCRKLQYTLYGYCLMPDHLHVLFSPGLGGTPLFRWLNSFKSYTTHKFMKGGGSVPLWQRSANDHVCRAAETVEAVLRYIANNPVRAGLVDKWEDWTWTKVFIG